MRIRFTLKAGLLFLTAVIVLSGIYAARVRSQRDVVESVHRIGGTVVYDFEENWNMPAAAQSNTFTANLLGNVSCVSLTGSQVTDRSFPQLERLSGLRGLELIQTSVTGSSLARLKSVPLQALFISGGKIDDSDLRWIAAMPLLDQLELTHVPITDQGVMQLRGMHLMSIGLRDTEVTTAGVRLLQNSTGAFVDWDDGFLSATAP